MNINSRNSMQGLTLIELMIAMVIGLLLLAGAASMFITNKGIYKDINDSGELQENGRFAMELLIRNIRNAGYPGCSDDMASVTNNLNNSSNATDLLNFTSAIEGSEAGADWVPSGNDSDVVDDMLDETGATISYAPGTDALTVRFLSPIYMNQDVVELTTDMANRTGVLTVNNADELQPNDMLAVSDCDGAAIFQLTADADSNALTLEHADATAAAYPNPPNNTQDASLNFDRTFPENSQISRYMVRRYYIGEFTAPSGETERALFQQTPTGVQVLVEGVEDMQILYGEDTTNDSVADTYVNAAGVGNWDNIINVKIAMLLRASQINGNLEVDNTVYDLLGTDSGPYGDKFRRRVFTTTVQIRNRAITG